MTVAIRNQNHSYQTLHCDMCGKEIILRHYPHGTYDRYSVFMDCTAHNPPGQTLIFDGFMSQTIYLCPICGEQTRDIIKTLIKKYPISRGNN